MLQNNNREIVRKIAFRSMKQKRIRNGIVILAVILTTFMFTTIFTIGASLAEGMVVMLTRQQGTRSSIYLDHPMAAQVQQIEENRYLYAAGVQIQAGTAYTSGEENTAILLSYYDTRRKRCTGQLPHAGRRGDAFPECAGNHAHHFTQNRDGNFPADGR